MARRFLTVCSRGAHLELGNVTAAAAIGFLTAECSARSAGWAVAVALRSLLRFLHLVGLIAQPLAQVVPMPAGWHLAALPQALTPEALSGLLASCDRRSAAGRRDYAVLLLLARLGLRAGEVAALQLADVGWRDGRLRVRGKGPRLDLLPLPAEPAQCHLRPPRSPSSRSEQFEGSRGGRLRSRRHVFPDAEGEHAVDVGDERAGDVRRPRQRAGGAW